MKGFARASITNRRGKKLVASEAMVIRGSYVDYRKGQIIIPPDGLYYTSRNGRNVRPLDGEAFFLLGRRAYLLSNKSYLVVKKDFRLDLWKEYPWATAISSSGRTCLLGTEARPFGIRTRISCGPPGVGRSGHQVLG